MNLRYFSVVILVIVLAPEHEQFRFFTPKFSFPQISFPKMPEIPLPSIHEYSYPKMYDFNIPKVPEFSHVTNWHPDYAPKVEVEQNIFKSAVKEEELHSVSDKERKPIHPDDNNLLTSKKEQISPKNEEKPISKSKQAYSNNGKAKDFEDELTDLAEDVIDLIEALSDSDSDEDDSEESTDKSDSKDWDLPSITFGRKNKKRVHKIGHKTKNKRLGKKIKKVSEALADLFKNDDSDEQNNCTLSTEGLNNLSDGDCSENGTEESPKLISEDGEDSVITFTRRYNKNGAHKVGHKRKNKHLGKKIKKLATAIDDMLDYDDSEEQYNSTINIEDDLSDDGSGEGNVTDVSKSESADKELEIPINKKHKKRVNRHKNKGVGKKIEKVTEAIEKLLKDIESGEQNSSSDLSDSESWRARSASNILNFSIYLPFNLSMLVLYSYYKITRA